MDVKVFIRNMDVKFYYHDIQKGHRLKNLSKEIDDATQK